MNSLTPDYIESRIRRADFQVLAGTTTTICALTLLNGYIVTGESACVDPANFNKEIGETIARKNAFEKIWTLEGYLLKQARYDTQSIGVAIPVPVIPPHDDLTAFVGVKVVNAKPMTRAVYNQLRGWELPADENGADEGFLVEYTDAQRPNVFPFKGYVSWSPKDVFETAYHPYGDGEDQKSTARQSDTGEVLGDGVAFMKPDDPEPLPFT